MVLVLFISFPAFVVTRSASGDRQMQSVLADPPTSGALNVSLTLSGNVNVNVTCIDLAGNEDPTPVVFTILVVSSVPNLAVAVRPPALTNRSSVSFLVVSSGVPGLIDRFDINITGAPSSDAAAALYNGWSPSLDARGAVAVNQTVTFTGLSGGDYSLQMSATDVLEDTGSAVNVSFTVDVSPPTSWFVTALPPYTQSSAMLVRVGASDSQTPPTPLVRVNGSAWQQLEATPSSDSDGVVGVFTRSGLPEGRCVVEAAAVDGAGNLQPPPYATLQVVVDTRAPDVAIAAAVTGGMVR